MRGGAHESFPGSQLGSVPATTTGGRPEAAAANEQKALGGEQRAQQGQREVHNQTYCGTASPKRTISSLSLDILGDTAKFRHALLSSTEVQLLVSVTALVVYTAKV